MLKCFITGASGFIGKNLVTRLRNQHDVYLCSRNQDLRVVQEYKPDFIFHLAAEIYDHTKMFDSNIALTYELLEHSKSLDYSAFIYVGSSSEYGRKTGPIKETDLLTPDTMYEATKGASSLLCQAYATMYDKPIAVARPFSVFGRHEPARRFIPTLYRCYKYKEELSLAAGVHDWLHVDDFVSGLILLAHAGQKIKKDIINFGSGVQTSNHAVVQVFEEIVGGKVRIRESSRLRSFDSEHWVCDTKYAKDKYGFTCAHTLRSGLESYIAEQDRKTDTRP